MNHSFLTNKYGDTNFITGIRAYAALAVLMIHAGGAGFREIGYIGNNIADLGKTGVYVFFVISGFSVATSFQASKNYFNYINKRFWRVAPLYYFWIAISLLFSATSVFWQQKLNVKIDAYNILMHLSFLSFFDYRITNTIIGVEWSIPIEVFWYTLVPLLIGITTNKKILLISFAVSLIIYRIVEHFVSTSSANAELAVLAFHWSPVPYILSYCLGISAYRLRKLSTQTNLVGNISVVTTLLLLLIYVIKPSVINSIFHDELIFISLITFALIVFGSKKSKLIQLLFANRLALYLGVISYGLYLSHMPLLVIITKLEIQYLENPALKFLALSCLAILISTVTYYFIEKPGISIGNYSRKNECK